MCTCQYRQQSNGWQLQIVFIHCAIYLIVSAVWAVNTSRYKLHHDQVQPTLITKAFFPVLHAVAEMLMACSWQLMWVSTDGIVMAEYQRTLTKSNFGRALQSRNIDLPESRHLPGDTMQIPFYFIDDEAFPLKKNITRPFSRRELLTIEGFFIADCRGRNSVESSFSMLKFGVLNTLTRCTSDKVDILVKTMCFA